jgi:hypothetical protein
VDQCKTREYKLLKNATFWYITPCCPLNVNRRFGGTYRVHLQGQEISRARNQRESRWQAELHLKMEPIRSSETSVAFQHITRRHSPEDSTLHNHRCEILKSYNTNSCLQENVSELCISNVVETSIEIAINNLVICSTEIITSMFFASCIILIGLITDN